MLEYASPHTIAGTARFLRDVFSGTILVVEGPTDARVYRSMVAEEHCQIIDAHTKENVIGCIDILVRAQVAGVLGIVDADFSHLDQDFPCTSGLFRTDAHDLETMMLSSPALDLVLAEFGSSQKLADYTMRTGTAIRDMLLAAALPVGCLRWLSIHLQLSLRFEGLDFRRFVSDRGTLSSALPALVTTVKNHSQRHDLHDGQLLAEIQHRMSLGHSPWQLCCGHDIVVALSISLRRLLGTNDASAVSPSRLEQSLRLSYRPEFFRSTILYSSLAAWENTTHFRLFS